MSRGLRAAAAGAPEGVPAVFLHGFLGRGDDWLPALPEGVQAILPDLPGHGASGDLAPSLYGMESCADAVADLLAACPGGRAALVGYSLGGRVALCTALRHAERVSRLVLVSCGAGLAGPAARARRRALDERRARALVRDGLASFLEKWYRQPLFASLAEQPELLRALCARRAQGDAAALARAVRGFSPGRSPAWGAELHALRVPLLVVAGARDAAYTEAGRALAAGIPGARFVAAPAGHAVPAEAPVWLRAILREFLVDAPRRGEGEGAA